MNEMKVDLIICSKDKYLYLTLANECKSE